MAGVTDNSDWRLRGVRVVRGDELDPNTPQTPGMTRMAAITAASAGASKLWAGTADIEPNAKTGAHHHGPVESVIYVVRGRARMRWGERLEFVAEAGPGDFIYVAPYAPPQEKKTTPAVTPVGAAQGEKCELRRASRVCRHTQRAGAGRREPRSTPRRTQSRRGALG